MRHRDPRRSHPRPLVPATAATAAAAASAAVAAVVVAATAVTGAAATATPTSSTASTTGTSRPRCTGCVEPERFGFEDATTQGWTTTGAATLAPVGAPAHGGGHALRVRGLRPGSGLRWPGTSDLEAGPFYLRAWVRLAAGAATPTAGPDQDAGQAAPPWSRGDVVLSVGDSLTSTFVATAPRSDAWIPLVVGPWPASGHAGAHGRVEISLTAGGDCATPAFGDLYLDDVEIGTDPTFATRPTHVDDVGALAAPLPAPTAVGCPTTTPTPTPVPTPGAASVLDFEDGTTQGWQPAGSAALLVTPKAAHSGALGLKVTGLARSGAAARLTTSGTAFGGDGDRLRLVAFLRGTAPTAASTRTAPPGSTPSVLVTVTAGTTLLSRVVRLTDRRGVALDVSFAPPTGLGTTPLTVTIAAAPDAPVPGSLMLDDVRLARVSSSG